MKTHYSNQRRQALTLVEVLVVIATIAILAAMLLPANHGNGKKVAMRMACVNNLKQVGLAYRVWAGDHDGKYPIEISVTDGGTMGPDLPRNAFLTFQIMSNELNTPKVLWCPADSTRTIATNFTTGFSNSKISYFVGLNADTNHPQALLSGDDNFEIGGAPVKSGLLELSTNTQIAWSSTRHKLRGNIVLADGSVQGLSNSGLTNWLRQNNLATNRIVIP